MGRTSKAQKQTHMSVSKFEWFFHFSDWPKPNVAALHTLQWWNFSCLRPKRTVSNRIHPFADSKLSLSGTLRSKQPWWEKRVRMIHFWCSRGVGGWTNREYQTENNVERVESVDEKKNQGTCRQKRMASNNAQMMQNYFWTHVKVQEMHHEMFCCFERLFPKNPNSRLLSRSCVSVSHDCVYACHCIILSRHHVLPVVILFLFLLILILLTVFHCAIMFLIVCLLDVRVFQRWCSLLFLIFQLSVNVPSRSMPRMQYCTFWFVRYFEVSHNKLLKHDRGAVKIQPRRPKSSNKSEESQPNEHISWTPGKIHPKTANQTDFWWEIAKFGREIENGSKKCRLQ